MEFTEKISALIFALIVIGVMIYVVMARFVTGSFTSLQRGEKIIILVGVAGIVMVVVYAAVELLLHVVF